MLIFNPAGREVASLEVADQATLWFSGTPELGTLPGPKDPLEHVRHYFHFVKDAPPKPSTILRVGAGGGPVFCPPAYVAY
jgi:hypothetical protein